MLSNLFFVQNPKIQIMANISARLIYGSGPGLEGDDGFTNSHAGAIPLRDDHRRPAGCGYDNTAGMDCCVQFTVSCREKALQYM